MSNLYRLHNSFESRVVLEVIEDNEELSSPKDTLINIFEKVCDAEWADMVEVIYDVRDTAISMIEAKHRNYVIDNPEPAPPNLMEDTMEQRIAFFKAHPGTVVQSMIDMGTLGFPSTEERVKAAMVPILYNLTDVGAIATELLAMSYTLPIALTSVPTQAKRINNSVFLEVEKRMTINLKIDAIFRSL